MAREDDDHSFNSLPTKNVSKDDVKLTHLWPEHITIIHLTLCHPEIVKGYFINPFMARAP